LRLYPEQFLRILLLCPPADEQAATVRFLDHANRRMDRLIRAKKKVIALLNEQKQVIVQRAVTRGLDPSVSLKASGIPWLGDIPNHWEVRRIKTIAIFVTSGSRGWARYYSDRGAIFLRIGNISTTSVDLRLDRITRVAPPIDAEGERTRVQQGDVLLSITAQIGAVGVVPSGLGDAYVNQHTSLIRPMPAKCTSRWMAYGLLSDFGKSQCRLRTNGGTKVGLTLDDVKTLCVLMPPLEEQQKTIDGIEERTRDLDRGIHRTQREVELIREYRTRLIADVVTGKLDVREAASKLTDEYGQPESLDKLESFAEEDETDDAELQAVAEEGDDAAN
jgi:type I restriction enzyme S subunit